jgi:hypothetical protein
MGVSSLEGQQVNILNLICIWSNIKSFWFFLVRSKTINFLHARQVSTGLHVFAIDRVETSPFMDGYSIARVRHVDGREVYESDQYAVSCYGKLYSVL